MSNIAAEDDMSRKYIKLGVVAAILLGFAGLAAYQFTGGNELSDDMDGLQTQFNRDKGKVRLLVLLAPT